VESPERSLRTAVEIENKEILNSFGPVDKKPFSREVGDANRADSGASQQTLGTPRASAGAAESALSEGPRAPPDCEPRADAGSRVRWRDSSLILPSKTTG